MTMKPEELLPFDIVSLLDSEAMIAEYLAQVLADGDKEELARAQGYIDRAREAVKDRDRNRPGIER